MPPDLYHDFADLTAREPNASYRIDVPPRPSPVAVIAPHGGGIESGTSELTRAIADEELSLCCLEGSKTDGNEALRITSICYDEPTRLVIVAASTVVLAPHGSDEQREWRTPAVATLNWQKG